jgi:CheY-like chemotaxis protein
MKAIIFDDNKLFAEVLCKKFNNVENCNKEFLISNGFEKLNELSDTVKEKICNDTVLFINVNIKAGQNTRQLQKGIELLTWLRIKGVMHHCVLYSFETFHSLLKREPRNIIAASKGTSFVQLPDKFGFDLGKLSGIKAEKENVKAVLKNTVNIESLRHQHANWWGIKQLFDVHNALFPQECKGFEYDESFKSQTSKLDYMIAVFVNNFSVDEILVQVNEIRKIELNAQIRGIENRINEIKKVLGVFNKEYDPRKPKLNLRKKITDDNNYKSFSGTIDSDAKGQDKETISRLERELEKKENELTNLRDELNSIGNNNNLNSSLISNDDRTSIREKINSIVYIDDNANNGWKDIFSLILFGVKNSEKICTLPENEFSDERLIDAALKLIKEKMPNVIMLDIRLLKKDDQHPDISQLASIEILKEVKDEFPGIPVLIVSASNKLITYEKTINDLGADGYWIKEGLDSIPNVNITANNYIALANHFKRFISDEYKLSRIIQDAVLSIKDQENPWWVNKKWPNSDTTQVDKHEIINNLKEIHWLYCIYLSHDWENMTQLKNLIIASSVLLVEKVHNFENNPNELFSKIAGGTWVHELISSNRGDYLAILLYQMRNNVAHANPSNFKFVFFKLLITAILYWLREERFNKIGTDNFLRIVNYRSGFNQIKYDIPKMCTIINQVLKANHKGEENE